MQYLVSFVCVMAMVASPVTAKAQAGEEATTSKRASAALVVHGLLPPQLMLRASYYLYLDADADTGATSDQIEPNAEEPSQSVEPTKSLLERWQPDAFVDPTKPKSRSEPALELAVDSAGLEVTPTTETQQTTQRSRGAKAGIAVGAILGAGLVGFGIGAAVAMSNFEI